MIIVKKQTTYQIEIGEVNEMASETVPNMAMSPQELLETYGRGNPMMQEFYDEENDWDMKGMDLTEIDMLREQLQEQQRTAKEKLGDIERYRLELIKKKSTPDEPIKEPKQHLNKDVSDGRDLEGS